MAHAPPFRLHGLLQVLKSLTSTGNVVKYFFSISVWLSFVSITPLVAKNYNVSENVVEWMNIIFPAVEVPGLLLVVYILQVKGLRFVVRMA